MSPIHIPSPPLNVYIENLYYVDGLAPYPHEKILADSRLDLKINFGGAIGRMRRVTPNLLRPAPIVGV